MKFRVPHESPAPVIVDLLRRAWPEATTGDLHRVIGSGRLRIDERVSRNPRRAMEPDVVVTVDDDIFTDQDFGVPDARELARTRAIVVIDRPLGLPGHRDVSDELDPIAFLADVLGMDRSTFRPVWSVPSNTSGPWVCAATDDDAEQFCEALADGSMTTWWTAIAPVFGLPTGELEGDGIHVSYATARRDGGLAEIQLKPEFADADAARNGFALICELLASHGAPILCDRDRGGYMAEGGLRLRMMSLYDESGTISAGWTPPADWWPDQPIVPRIEPTAPDEKPRGIPRLRVSAKTLEVLQQGHQWALEDAQSDSIERLPSGSLVQLAAPNDRLGPFALIDGTHEILARVWSDDPEAASDFAGEIELRVDDAFARRKQLFANLTDTDLFRVIHSEADGLPGLLVDRVGPLYRATLTGFAALRLRERVYDLIADLDPDAMILEVAHQSDVRTREELPNAQLVTEGARYVREGERVIGREDGLRYWCEPWQGIDVGFFADQRENRRRAVSLARPGSRWLNLFCHTGAYSVALVAAGAHVTSVDLSRRYLDWLDENLALNDLSLDSNRNVDEDARQFLKNDDDEYDGIIVDPPTAAASEAGFWSVHKDYETLLVECFRRLAPGGAMLVCRNARKKKPTLEELVRGAADKAGVKLSGTEPAPPALDYPRLRAFPEGDSFEGLWAFR